MKLQHFALIGTQLHYTFSQLQSFTTCLKPYTCNHPYICKLWLRSDAL